MAVALTLVLHTDTSLFAQAQWLYDADTLAYWQMRYRTGLEGQISDIIDSLDAADQARLRGLRVLLPDKILGADPVGYYSLSSPPTLVASALSLKFLDDYLLAQEWLADRNYSSSSALDYVAQLKYGVLRVPPGRNADPKSVLIRGSVSDQANAHALRAFSSAIWFIVAHELGHIVHRHAGGRIGPAAQRQEIQADSFAIEVMRRNDVIAAGAAAFFILLAQLERTPADFDQALDFERYRRFSATHPLSPHRLHRFAAALAASPCDFDESRTCANRERVIAFTKMVNAIATQVGDGSLAQFIRDRAEAAAGTELQPRRTDELIPSSTLSNARLLPFEGDFVGTVADASGRAQLQARLSRAGPRVTGIFGFGYEGALVGTVSGDSLLFDWIAAGSKGRGVLRYVANRPGEVMGSWGLQESRRGFGTWSLKRRPK